MPKNMFQRPARPITNHSVPRHGAPLPAGKIEAKKILKPKDDSAQLPPIEVLLAKSKKPE